MDYSTWKEQVREATDANDIANELILSDNAGQFFCPNCQTNGGPHMIPQLEVSEKGFTCPNCGNSGDVIDLVVMAASMTESEATKYLARRAGISRRAR